jgi:hypothetical protein
MNLVHWSGWQRCERCSESLAMGDYERDEIGRIEYVTLVHVSETTCDAVITAYPRSNGEIRLTVR